VKNRGVVCRRNPILRHLHEDKNVRRFLYPWSRPFFCRVVLPFRGVNQTREYRSPSIGAVQWSCFHPSNSSGAYRTPYEFPSTKRPPPSKSPSPTQKGKTLSRTASAINVRCELRVAVNSTVGRELAFFVLVFWWCAIGPEDAARTSGQQGQGVFQFENGGYELGKEVVGHWQSTGGE